MSMSEDSNFVVRLVDWNDKEDSLIAISLLDNYVQNLSVDNALPSIFTKEHLPAKMAATPGAFSVIGFQAGVPTALANCFTALNLSSCKPVVKIQNLIVLSDTHRKNIAQQLLNFVIERARLIDTRYVTLEIPTGEREMIVTCFEFGFISYGAHLGNAIVFELAT